MSLTFEQELILSTAIELYSNSTCSHKTIMKIASVAGSGKTHTLRVVAEALPHSAQLYMAYNKSIAEESKSKFPSYVQCKTTHSLAYTPIIKYGLDLDGMQGKPRVIGTFTHRDIKESNIDYEDKILIIQALEEFFLSKYTDINIFLDEEEPCCRPYLVKKYFLQMIANKIPCTHAFYLKMYHILLVDGHIHYDKPFDVIMLDEAGDINEVTLGIFLALPAHLKIMVGDPLQNIYSFNHTINGFHALKDVGVTKHLSQSFRCSEAIADSIESFCQRHLDSTTVFKGTDHSDHTIRTEAIISRTNSGLIHYMIEMCEADIPFNLTREAKHIFATMLTLMNLKEGVKIFDSSMKFLQKDVDYYFNSPTAQKKWKTCLMFIKYKYEAEEPDIKIAIGTILKYGASKIYIAYKYAKNCEATPHDHAITLTTAHSSKGLTWDSITIADDFDLDDILQMSQSERSNTDQEELRLYYVAASRSRLQLNNAIYLRK